MNAFELKPLYELAVVLEHPFRGSQSKIRLQFMHLAA